MSGFVISAESLAAIIREVDGNHDLSADALAEAIIVRVATMAPPQIVYRTGESKRRGPPPTRQQAGVLKWMRGRDGIETRVQDIPMQVAWYAAGVVERMVARGWVAQDDFGRIVLTEAGKAQVTA